MGPLVRLVLPLVELIYRLAGGLSLSAMEPIFAAGGSGQTPLLFVQGTGDTWGSVKNVVDMVAASPTTVEPIYVESNGHFGGYQYVIDHPETLDAFFSRQLA